MEITHVWTKLLPHKGGKEKSHIEVLSAQVMPTGKEASRRLDFWYENEKQLNPIVTGVVYDRALREAQANPDRHYYVTQFDAESSPDAPYNLPMNNPSKIDPKTTFMACAAMARQLCRQGHKV